MRKFLLFAVTIFLSACAALPPPPPGIVLAPGVRMVLPPLRDFGRSLEATQLITAHYGGGVFVFQNRVSLTPERGRIAVFDPMGRTAITVDWTKDGVRYTAAPWLPPQVRPANMLADFVLAAWPAASVQKAIAASGARLVSTPDKRAVMTGEREVIHVEYHPGGRVFYRNLAWGYRLDIQSAETGP